jgi:hypothetical protein
LHPFGAPIKGLLPDEKQVKVHSSAAVHPFTGLSRCVLLEKPAFSIHVFLKYNLDVFASF